MSIRLSKFHTTRGGFSLTELLVVMGIILLLVGFLFPIVGRSFDQSQSVQCRANLKQLSASCTAYAADSGGVLPWPNWYLTEATGQTGWLYTAPCATNPYATVIQQGVVWPYIQEPNIYRCPADRKPWKLGPTELLTSYIMNGAICGFGTQLTSNYLVQMPAAGVEFWESAGAFKCGSATASEAQSQRHGDRGANIVCFDGHTELLVYRDWLTVEAKSPGRLWCNPKTKNGH